MPYSPPSPPYLGPPNRHSGEGNKPVYRIVLHGTVSPTVRGGAREIARYFRSSAAGGSAHYVVDPGEVVQVAWDSVVAWHAPPNPHSLGVEFCDPVGGGSGPLPLSRWNEPDHRAMLNLGAHLVAGLCLAYEVPVQLLGPGGLKTGSKGICEHSDVSEAFRQSSHWDLGNFPRRDFLNLVRRHAAALRRGVEEPAEPAAANRLTHARDLLEQAARKARQGSRKKQIERALFILPEK